nr:hypothetical protein RSP597_18905 [Ralstonia solanacearum]
MQNHPITSDIVRQQAIRQAFGECGCCISSSQLGCFISNAQSPGNLHCLADGANGNCNASTNGHKFCHELLNLIEALNRVFLIPEPLQLVDIFLSLRGAHPWWCALRFSLIECAFDTRPHECIEDNFAAIAADTSLRISLLLLADGVPLGGNRIAFAGRFATCQFLGALITLLVR